MNSQRWAIIDTETDGLQYPIHVVEIAAQLMDGWSVVGEPFQVFINHNVPILGGAFDVHGYSQDFLREHGLPPREAHERLRDFTGSCPLASHNLNFDWDMALKPEWEMLGIPPVGTPGLCLLKLARRVVCEASGYSLDVLRDTFKVNASDRHHALGDVQALVELFSKIYRPRLERARVCSFGSWRAFSIATPINLCWARCLTPEQIEKGAQEKTLRRLDFAKQRTNDYLFGCKHLFTELKRIYSRGSSAARINKDDFTILFQILAELPHLRKAPPGDFLWKWIRDFGSDGFLPDDQEQALYETIRRLVKPDPDPRHLEYEYYVEGKRDPLQSGDRNAPGVKTAFGFLNFDQKGLVVFENRSFCFTGKFAFGTREECERTVIARGGTCTRRLVRETDYLVVGSLGGYGSKVDELVNLRRQGSAVRLIEEQPWTQAVAESK